MSRVVGAWVSAWASAVAAALLIAGVVVAANVTVHVGSFYFEDGSVGDGTVTAKVGDRLTFVFDDSGAAGKRHSAVVTELGIDSGPQPVGATWTSPVISTPGTFRLFCKFHQTAPNSHVTTLVVSGSAATPRPTASPTRPPASTATPEPAPTAGASAGATPRPTSSSAGGPTARPSDDASASPAASALDASLDPGATAAEPSAEASPDASAAPGPDGQGGGPDAYTWLRSVRLGLLAGVPILLVALLAARVSLRRRA